MAENPPVPPTPTVDPGRLRRAVHLDAERQPDGSWRVSGGKGAHIVNADARTCNCADFEVRGGLCKHILAVRLMVLAADLRLALCAIVPRGP